MEKKQTDIHTEHCCIIHGCKYGEEETSCTVWNGLKRQSCPCDRCLDENIFFDIYYLDHAKDRAEEFKKRLENENVCKEQYHE